MTPADSDLFSGPVAVMLAKTGEVPRATPGGPAYAYEWKYDGFRQTVVSTDAGVTLYSRSGTNLSVAFPDVVEAVTAQVPPGVVLDGEVCIFSDGSFSFDQLQHRMVSRPEAAARLARQHPASYIAFDILAVGGIDVRHLSWRDRRGLLDELAASFTPPIQASPYVDDYKTAIGWLAELPPGIEGIVSKNQRSAYKPGDRGWIKTKILHVSDAIVGAVIGPISRPDALVAGRYTAAGRLRIVGRSTPLNTRQAAQLAEVLTAVPAAEHPWPNEIGSGHFGGGSVAITHVDPVVVIEIAADTALQAGRHRHAIRFVRLRADLSAADITLD